MADAIDGKEGRQGAQAPQNPNEIIAQFQMLQQQLQSILVQKENMVVTQAEVEKALEELAKTKDESAYKIVGNVMVRKPVADLKAQLEETKEDIGLRLMALDKSEKKTTETLRALQEKVKQMIK
jgi:prefoldin beta subunit